MIQKSFFKKTLLIVSMGIALGLYGCGGGSTSTGGGTPDVINTGVFIDAPVKGLEYSTATQSGVTNESGEFKYKSGETVAFKIDGLEIGAVNAASEVPVTALPKYIEVARLLQSLDIDSLEELIDISGIKIPASIKTQLNDLLSNNQSNFDSVLTQAALESIGSESQVQLVNVSPVTEQAAIQHITGSISENFTTSDFNRQTYVSIEDALVLSYEDDGTGFEFINSDGANNSPQKSPYTWTITNNKVVVSYDGGETVTASLLSVDGNRYSVSVTEPDGTFIADLYKAKSFSVSALNGKILSLDTTNDSECTQRTIKVTGSTGSLKELCNGGFFETPVTLSNASRLDNTVYIRGTNSDGSAFSIKTNLIQGDLNGGKFSTIFNPSNATPEGVEILTFNATNTEVQP